MKNPPSVTAATKTFPLHSSSLAEETNGSNNSTKECDHKEFNKSKFNRWITNCIVSSRKRQPPDETTGISTESSEKKNTVPAGASEDRGDLEDMKSVVTCKNRLSLCRKKYDDKTRSSGSCSRTHPGSPASTSNSKAPNASVLAPWSTTVLELDDEKIQPLTAPKKEERKLGSVVGMSMIVVTLVIMVVWGRLCAIVWTLAWLYLVPRLRTSLSEVQAKPNRDKNISSNIIASVKRREECEFGGSSPDLDSAEYKRRVVLEGFLERNRRLTAF